MAQVFEELANLDRFIHEPARLSIMTALSAVSSADFVSLQRLTGLSVGNLSNHIIKLEEAGFVQTKRVFVNKRTNTQVSITDMGRQTIEGYWQQMEILRQEAQKWQ
jgi:DNA-binding MarR family transcriptional regulator